MCKTRTKTIAWIVVLMLFVSAVAFGGFTSLSAKADGDETPEVPEATEVMNDPTFYMDGFPSSATSTMKLMSDNTVHAELYPSNMFGARAVASAMGDSGRYNVADGVRIELHNVTLDADARLYIAMETTEKGTVSTGGGLYVGVGVLTVGANCYLQVLSVRADAGVEVNPQANGELLPGTIWHADELIFEFTDGSFKISYTGSTNKDQNYTRTTESLFIDYTDETRPHYNPNAYLGIACYTTAGAPMGKATFDIAKINDKAPGVIYTEKLNAQVTAFTQAVATAEESEDNDDIAAAVALNTFGADQAYGKLLAQFGTSEQKSAVASAREKIVLLNGDNVFAEYKAGLDAYIAALDAYDLEDEATAAAAIEKYNAVKWELYNSLNPSYQAKADELIDVMKSKSYFRQSIHDIVSAYVTTYETATTAEFASSAGYLTVKTAVDGWEDYKEANFVSSIAEARVTALDERMAAVKEKLESSFYHKFGYRGTQSTVQLYDEGLYLSVKPDPYNQELGKVETNNIVLSNEKMTLNENSEVCFNMIYAFRGAVGAFQIQIGFYPVAGASTYDSDGVRVDLWTTNAGTTQVKPVNGKTETDICGNRTITMVDEDFFDFEADELDYKQSAYDIKLCSDEDGLYVSVNELRIYIEDESITPELFRDGVYVTFSACGASGIAPYELLVTKIGSAEYADIFDEPQQPEDPGTQKPGNTGNNGNTTDKTKKKCGSSLGSATSVIVAIICLTGAAVFVAVRRNKRRA